MKNSIVTFTSSTIGNITIEPSVLRKLFKKECQSLSYDPQSKRTTFSVNDGSGGKIGFEIDGSSYENAQKIAEGFGLKEQAGMKGYWSIWYPKLYLDHNGSELAETLRMEMLRLGIPYETRKAEIVGLTDPPHRYTFGRMWSFEDLLKIIRDTAERYKDQLQTAP